MPAFLSSVASIILTRCAGPLFRHLFQMTLKTALTGSRNTDPVPDYSALLGAAGDAQESAAMVTQARSEHSAPSKPVHAYRVD